MFYKEITVVYLPLQILREKGHIIPATRIIEHGDPFSRAVLSEDISMGQKWTHYGSRGEYGTLNQNFIFLDNPWSSDASAFVVPFYFDPRNGPICFGLFGQIDYTKSPFWSYKIDALSRQTIVDSLNWFNSELNGCIAFKEASELLLPRVEKRLMITDGGGCWSYLGSIQTPEEGQRISISDGCYGKRVEYSTSSCLNYS